MDTTRDLKSEGDETGRPRKRTQLESGLGQMVETADRSSMQLDVSPGPNAIDAQTREIETVESDISKLKEEIETLSAEIRGRDQESRDAQKSLPNKISRQFELDGMTLSRAEELELRLLMFEISHLNQRSEELLEMRRELTEKQKQLATLLQERLLLKEKAAAKPQAQNSRYFMRLRMDSPGKRKQLEEALDHYSKLRERIRSDSEARQFISEIWMSFQNAQREGIFSALCVPSGTGKTQLAFCLPTDCAVVYLNTSESSETVSRQDIYNCFQYADFVNKRISEDWRIGFDGRLWIYGFVDTLLSFFKENRLPIILKNLAMVEIVTGTPTAGINEYEIVPTLLDTVQKSVKEFRKSSRKNLLFFLDEFTARDNEHRKQLAFMRRCLLKVDVCVVVASTNSGAMNMFDVNAASVESRERKGHYPWVQLVVRLPKFVPDPLLKKLVDAYDDASIRELFQLCLKSRPIFAIDAEAKLHDWLKNSDRREGVIQLMENIREQLIVTFRSKRQTFSSPGCYGYLLAMLCVGAQFRSCNDKLRKVLSITSTKNWAYLVNEASFYEGADSSEPPEPTQFLEFALLNRATTQSAFAKIYRKNGVDQSSYLYYVTRGGQTKEFKVSVYFPDFDNDFLLYLVLAGSAKFPGLKILTNEQDVSKSQRISTAHLMSRYAPEFPKETAPSSDAPRPDDRYHEMLVAAAFMTASNAGSLSPCSLEVFIAKFVSELINSENFVRLALPEKIEWSGDWKSSFLWPCNARVPTGINALLNASESVRPKDTLGFDFGSFKRVHEDMVFSAIAEAKSQIAIKYVRKGINKALRRQRRDAKVSFIITQGSVRKLWPFHISRLRVNDAPEQTLNETHMYRIVIQRSSVDESSIKLFRMDTNVIVEPSRLIFVISLDDIADPFAVKLGVQ